ncbi:type I methionyl aminopeptidase [Oceanicola sp. 502str15]|uniref:type I methionyl aminopeptidase n=1 Tax=Oceanicola sp. 502str15 TaxID=2696061 RepID=UPI00209562A4|nr:type I methionyl aminopeptidase [Oceanicola sp. 502str15]MCO6383407.1 type I methionyl aminopeptidase [Oceanicola sp. 502str15]
MTITHEDELDGLKEIGRIVAETLQAMGRALEPGMTTAELDAIGAELLEREGAVSAPESCYGFPGATCISTGDVIAHGIPGPEVIRAGELVNIDVSASKQGFFADTGASFRVGDVPASLKRLCTDGRKACQIGVAQVQAGRPIAAIGVAVGQFAAKRGYTLIRNLASHGTGRALHEYPEEIATWPNRDRRRITDGLVLTVEPFLSRGGLWAEDGGDGWSLLASPHAACVQYEHTVVATRGKPITVTLPG